MIPDPTLMPISPHLQSLRSLIGTHLLQVPSVAAVIFNEHHQILLQLRSLSHTWGLPAGAIDPGETPEVAVIREVKEETGLDVEPVALLGVFSGLEFRRTYENGDKVEFMVAVFRCRIIGGEIGGFDEETLECRWFAIEEMPAMEGSFENQVGSRCGLT